LSPYSTWLNKRRVSASIKRFFREQSVGWHFVGLDPIAVVVDAQTALEDAFFALRNFDVRHGCVTYGCEGARASSWFTKVQSRGNSHVNESVFGGRKWALVLRFLFVTVTYLVLVIATVSAIGMSALLL